MRWWSARRGRRGPPSRPLTFDDVLTALGDDGVDSRRCGEVPLTAVVGTLDRGDDFDEEFRLLNRALCDRWDGVGAVMRTGSQPGPVDLLQLGDLYFVVDGHHRVSVARALGRDTIVARVLRICTVAYATRCLRRTHLETKAAERRFLERVPLGVGLRCGLWLDCPGDWLRLADSAEAWGRRHARRTGRVLDRYELAGAWWAHEVSPVAEAARGAGRGGAGEHDVRLYLDALSSRCPG
jgi:uncharacterized ParB-like nuclease family protein